MNNLEGFLLINKQKGITSYDVIRYFKKQNIKKIGHTGTLDPDTEGLLVLAIGRATKFIPSITENSQKEYITTMKIGIKTDTSDIGGKVIYEQKNINISQDAIEEAIKSFIKEYEQVPPVYSSKKINGKKAYEYGREGKEIDMSIRSKKVNIYNIEILDINMEILEVTFKTLVSKGTYIRSLIEDIAQELNTVATMKSLIRTKTDGFLIEDAKVKEKITSQDCILLEQFLKQKYKEQIKVSGRLKQLVQNGVQINNENIVQKFDKITKDRTLLIIDEQTDKVIAVYKKIDKVYKVDFMLWR